MTRRPNETSTQWFARATREYVDAWTAFQAEWQRLSRVGLSLLAVGYPTLDDGYDGALDSLEDADNERSEATTELNRESLAVFRAAPRVNRRHGGRFGTDRQQG